MKAIAWAILGLVLAGLSIGGISAGVKEFADANGTAGVTAAIIDMGITVLLGWGAYRCFRRSGRARRARSAVAGA